MKVREAMKKEIIRVKRSTSLTDLLNLFNDFHTLPLIPVVDDCNFLIGVVYLENLLEILRPPQVKLLKNIPFAEVDEHAFDLELAPAMGSLILVDDIMEKNFVSLEEETSLESAYKMMHLHKREQIPVADKDRKLLGIVGIFDIVRRMFKEKGVI